MSDSVYKPDEPIKVDGTICDKAIETFGDDYMLTLAMEEPAELIQAISKMRRAPYSQRIEYPREHLLEEIGDCYIILEELARLYNFSREEINGVIAWKQSRTEKQIKEHLIQERWSVD